MKIEGRIEVRKRRVQRMDEGWLTGTRVQSDGRNNFQCSKAQQSDCKKVNISK